ncbi:MAG: N-acetylneuraminate lyase [Paenibacillus sp.]|jgi:N-acetylneuraminate lyase|nr:N-acetylneuraminate lyase [Paenibacillus sp.]
MTSEFGETLKLRPGVYPALHACYSNDGNVNPVAVRKLTRFLIDRGVNGLYVGGGTGEGLLQTAEERMKTLEAAIEENNGAVPIIAHVGAMTTGESVRMAKHAEQAGADAISSVPPFYFTYPEAAVKQYWNSIMESVQLPFIIYYIPASTGFHMTVSFLKELLENEKLLGIKMTTPGVYELQQYKEAGGERFLVYNGIDQQYLPGRIMGAHAGIGGNYNVMPELYVRLEQAFRKGAMEEAQRLQIAINEVLAAMKALGGLFPIGKELLRLRGIDCGLPREPLPAANVSDREAIRAILDNIMRAVEEEAPSSVGGA